MPKWNNNDIKKFLDIYKNKEYEILYNPHIE